MRDISEKFTHWRVRYIISYSLLSEQRSVKHITEKKSGTRETYMAKMFTAQV